MRSFTEKGIEQSKEVAQKLATYNVLDTLVVPSPALYSNCAETLEEAECKQYLPS
jgi:phosphohistidine phosphatase SixA